MTDKEHAAAIRQHIDALRKAVQEADKAGLTVDFDWDDTHDYIENWGQRQGVSIARKL